MERNKVNIVFISDFKDFVWNEKINSDLNSLLKELNLNLGKSLEQKIEFQSDGSQTISILEKPAFSNEKIQLSFSDNRIDFNIILNEDFEEQIEFYFNYLEKIVDNFNMKVDRTGISYIGILDKINLKRFYLPLFDKKEMNSFGIKGVFKEKLNNTNLELNIFTALEDRIDDCLFLIDINTDENKKDLTKNEREKFLLQVKLKLREYINYFKEL